MSLYSLRAWVLSLMTLRLLKMSPAMEQVTMRMKKRQMVLKAVMAEGSRLIEMKFLKSFRFFRSSPSFFVYSP